MSLDITPIGLRWLFGVNCYLIETDSGYVLIDTGLSRRRRVLEAELRSAGCEPGKLRLIVLTHAHGDHAGSCAYLRKEYHAPIAMHGSDVGKAERGDMFWSPDRSSLSTVIAKALSSLVGLASFEPFEPDVLLHDGQDLGEYGLNATALHLPGHSPGSLGILCNTGDFFCGDLFTNTRRPEKNTLIDDAIQLDESVARLGALQIGKVYPGHGTPFPVSALKQPETVG